MSQNTAGTKNLKSPLSPGIDHRAVNIKDCASYICVQTSESRNQ